MHFPSPENKKHTEATTIFLTKDSTTQKKEYIYNLHEFCVYN